MKVYVLSCAWTWLSTAGAVTIYTELLAGIVYAGQVESVYGRQVLQGTMTGSGVVYEGGGEAHVVTDAVINADDGHGWPSRESSQA